MMDSRHSGFLKGIQLLSIETEELLLVMTGNVDLNRYNEDSYKAFFDNNESMYFSCSKEAMIKIFDVHRKELVEQSGQAFLPIFFENGMYELQVQPKKNEKIQFWHEYEGFRNAIHPFLNTKALTGVLYFQNEVGYSNFEIRDEEGNTLLSVVIEVYPTKLDYKKDYQALLDEVNEEVYNLAYDFLKRTFLQGSAKIYKDPTGAEFYRLLKQHFNQYLKAIDFIEKRPCRRLETFHEEVRGDRLRKQDTKGRSFLRKNANLFVEVENGIVINGTQMLPKKGLLIKKAHTVDTHENRYVKMTMERLYQRIGALYNLIINLKEPFQRKPDSEIVLILQTMQNQLSQKLTKSFWRSIGKLDRSIMSMVLQMAAGYRDVFQIYATLSKGIVLSGELYKMSIKDIATLYEYWTFLRLGKILNEKCEQISQDIVKVSNNGLVVNLKKDTRAKRIFRNKTTGELIKLQYQYSTGQKITVNQKPDTMLSIEKLGRDYHYQYIFDAKYRINFNDQNSNKCPGPMEEDINTMHRYRDAIVAERNGAYERIAFGAYVLFPWNDTDNYQEHELYKSIKKVNIGGLPFLPKATDLVEGIIDNLLNKSADELQNEGILPQGTKEFLYDINEELILIVPVNGKLKKIVLDRFIGVPFKALPKQWAKANKIALWTSEGIKEEGIIEKVERKNDQLIFNVEAWASRLSPIQTKEYSVNEPILVEEYLYLEARYLPELLFFSNEQRQLLMMLKGTSNDVEVKLNDFEITQKTRIYSFKVNNHEFIWTSESLIYLLNDDFVEEINLEDLKQNSYKILSKLAKRIKV